MGEIKILEPVAAIKEDTKGHAALPDTLVGKTLGLLSNGWRSFDVLMQEYEQLAVDKHGVTRVINRRHWNASGPAPIEYIEELTKSDVAFVGLGH